MRLADLIFAVAGEVSQFQQSHGFSIDGADLTSSALPEGWRTRLVKVQNENTAAPRRPPAVHRLVLDKEDLCVAKVCAFREKDRNSVDALISDGLVDVRVIADRITTVLLRYSSNVERAAAWLAFRSNPDSRRVGGDSEPPLRDPRRSTIMLLRTVGGELGRWRAAAPVPSSATACSHAHPANTPAPRSPDHRVPVEVAASRIAPSVKLSARLLQLHRETRSPAAGHRFSRA